MATTFGILSTFPPTQCGLATFSQALVTNMIGVGAQVGVVSVVDAALPAQPIVAHQFVISQRGATKAAAAALNNFDIAVIQHEYGIYGGRDGADVLAVLAEIRVPVITVLHTVLTNPSPNQHRILAGIVKSSAMCVTMTQTARQRLIAGWGADPEHVMVIAHGAQDNRVPEAEPHHNVRPTILTWGLLGRGKGIEWAIAAMAGLVDLDPAPLYQVVGQTHPRVVEREGEAYRETLTDSVAALGLDAMVTFDGRYTSTAELLKIVRSADIILLPYDSRDQVTSGVLTEAVVAGKPVVSTSFPHAVELLSSGAGLLVPQGDSEAISTALRRVLTEPGLAKSMAATARDLTPGLLWPAVATQYVELGEDLSAAHSRDVAKRSVA